MSDQSESYICCYTILYVQYYMLSYSIVRQQAKDQVLQGIPGTQGYLDDITVTGWDQSSHLANLEAELTRLTECGQELAEVAFVSVDIQRMGAFTWTVYSPFNSELTLIPIKSYHVNT